MNSAVLIVLLALPFAIIGASLVFILKQNKREKTLGNCLSLQGTTGTGQIVKHRVEKTGRVCRCYLTYKYFFEGREYEYEQSVNIEGFNSVRDGETVEVLFLPQEPSIARLVPIDRFQFYF